MPIIGVCRVVLVQMENYSKHLESVVEARTQQLMEEKQRTDALLYSELALLRLRLPPEYFHFSLETLIAADGCMLLNSSYDGNQYTIARIVGAILSLVFNLGFVGFLTSSAVLVYDVLGLHAVSLR